MLTTRRTFLTGVGCCTAIAAMQGGRLTDLAFGAPNAAGGGDILVNIFLRGGIDGLNAVVPFGDANYATNRPEIKIKVPGQQRGALDLNGFFGLHPSMTGLHQLYQMGHLGVVVATGLPNATRSHFDAQAMMDRGTPGNKATSTGWIARHLMSSPDPAASIPALAAGGSVPPSLLGFLDTAAFNRPSEFRYYGNGSHQDLQYTALRKLYTGDHWAQSAGKETLDILDEVAASNPVTYVPANGAAYSTGGDGYSLGESLKTVAQMVKLNVGLRAASLDFGGWDTHEYQGNDGEGRFASLIGALSQNLLAFYTDLGDYANRLVVVVMSEFGRRLQQNKSFGTDHGHGNMVLVLGGQVKGGLYGSWPGLATSQLDEQKDLAITTDYRQILAEIIVRRLNNPNLYSVFSNKDFTYQPLNMLNGVDTIAPPPIDNPVDQPASGATKLAIPAIHANATR